MRRTFRLATLALAGSLAVTSCAPPPRLSDQDERVQVVTTTGLLRDLVQQVGGDRVNVVSIVPDGADPHSFEPTLRSARDAAYADAAFSNYALLEEHAVVKVLDANIDADAPNVALAEGATKYAAEVIPLVENLRLDTPWLGLRSIGDGAAFGADRASQVRLSVTAATGPGDAWAYLTGTFGDTTVTFGSADGFDDDDTAVLPLDAHTHMSWAFTEPGVYRLRFEAVLQVDDDAPEVPRGAGTLTFAVGVDPARAGVDDAVVVDGGHADLAADVDTGRLVVRYDPDGGGDHSQRTLPLDDVVVEVPTKALSEVPAERSLRFLGRPGTEIYQLPQAVLGKHVHGEIDPHLWHDVRNVMAYVQLVRDTLVDVDPAGASVYRARTRDYLRELDRLDATMRRAVGSIPASRRHLVTSHDAFGYLAKAYGLKVSGFVTPHPGIEPSLADRRRLARTIADLDVPAVFLEPNLRARSSTLVDVAREQHVKVCPLYGDAFDATVRSYTQLVRHNARSLVQCLAPQENP